MTAKAAATKKAPAKKAKATATEVVAPAAPVVITSYKGFDKDLKCRGFQFEIGKEFVHDGPVAACEGGFHACEYPLNVLRYYPANKSRFAVVEQSGAIGRHDEDTKIASQRITIKAEIDIAGLIKAAIKYTMDRCTPADGAQSDAPNTVVSAEGKNKSATDSGPSGAATASGPSGKAKGENGCALFLVERDGGRKIIAVWAGIAGRDGIKADTFYTLRAGKPVEA